MPYSDAHKPRCAGCDRLEAECWGSNARPDMACCSTCRATRGWAHHRIIVSRDAAARQATPAVRPRGVSQDTLGI